MTIEVTLGDLVAANQSLLEIGEVNDIPPKASFRIARAIRKTRDELRGWNDARRKIMQESGKASTHPSIPSEIWIDPKNITPEETEALEAKMRELNATTVTVECNRVGLNDLGAAKVKPKWLADLDWLIVEEAA